MRSSSTPHPALTALLHEHRALADYLDEIAEQPLSFAGRYANGHSARNHVHLWFPEYLADRNPKVTLAAREAAVRYILDRWRARLPGYVRSSPRGFRLYCYSDMAPTVSVVGETGEGCPYGGDLTFVSSLSDVIAEYAGRSWGDMFGRLSIDGDAILKAIRKNEGSLGGSARALGLPLAELRRRIEWWGLGPDVNRIRKHHKRRPAQFLDENHLPTNVKIYEERVTF